MRVAAPHLSPREPCKSAPVRDSAQRGGGTASPTHPGQLLHRSNDFSCHNQTIFSKVYLHTVQHLTEEKKPCMTLQTSYIPHLAVL
jgi:hypothetical protein